MRNEKATSFLLSSPHGCCKTTGHCDWKWQEWWAIDQIRVCVTKISCWSSCCLYLFLMYVSAKPVVPLMYISLFTVDKSLQIPYIPPPPRARWMHPKDGIFLLAVKNLMKMKMGLTVEELQVAFKKSKTGKATGNRRPPKWSVGIFSYLSHIFWFVFFSKWWS